MATKREEAEAIAMEAWSSAGTSLLSYDQLVEFQDMSNKMGRILQSVEAYEMLGDVRMLRLDATASYAYDDHSAAWHEHISQSRAYLVELLSTVADKELLMYKVWTDASPEADSNPKIGGST